VIVASAIPQRRTIMKMQSSAKMRSHRSTLASRVIAAVAVSVACAVALPASAGALDRIKETGHIKLGYMVDVRPFTYRNEAGSADGFTIALCQQVVAGIKQQLGLPQLAVDWVEVTPAGDMALVRDGAVDLLCSPAVQTLDRRRDVSFSIPVYPAGLRAVMRKDAAEALRAAINNTPGAKARNGRPVWRGSPAAKLLDKKSFAVVAGSTSQTWLAGKIDSFGLDAKTVVVPDYKTGVQQVVDQKADVFLGDRAVLMGAITSAQSKQVAISDRMLTNEPLSLTLARGDDDFRLAVDRALSATYASASFAELYAKWCGALDDSTRAFYSWVAVQE
jgi:polar amino acid transport system substrate-binding protein